MLPRGTPISSLFERSDSVRVRGVELRAGDDLQHRREKLARIILDDMYQFVALLDVDGTLLEVNRAALHGGGMKLEDVRDKPFWEARWWTVSRETQEQLRRAIATAATGEFVRYDVEVYGGAAGSETIVIDFSIIPITDSAGQVVFLLPEGRNITEKKRAEAEIARKNQELERLLVKIRELDQLKSQFFANVSHELRTPLALILGPAEKILAAGSNLTELQRRDLSVVRRNATALLKHVNDLLDVAKLDAGKMEVRYAASDLAKIVRIVAGQFEALAPQREVTYEVETLDRLEAEVDPEKVERILLNLLSNAFKFVPSGGRVKASLSTTAEGRALIVVQDSGPGVPSELRGVIFERFRQAEGGSTRSFGGTGLGLAIVKDFVALHNGTVTVTDAPGGGALFQVELPLRAPEGAPVRRLDQAETREPDAVSKRIVEELEPLAGSSTGGAAPENRREAILGSGPKPQGTSPVTPDEVAQRGGKPLVLVVEDNPEMNRFIVDTLAPDFATSTAFDGQEGLARAIAESPDLIITDIMMPRMSGDLLTRAVRERSELEGVPILVLSAKADDALRVDLLRNGAQDYMVKPFSMEELRARASNLAKVKRTRDLLRAELATRDAAPSEGPVQMARGHVRSTVLQGPVDDDIEALAEKISAYRRELRHALDVATTAWDAAKRASQAKSDFLGMVSHELRTPLTTLSLQVELLECNIQSMPPKQQERLRKMSAATQRLLGLVESLLEYARIESGRLALHVTPIDAAAVTTDVIEEMRPRAIKKGLALAVNIMPIGVFVTDARLLRLITSNLIDNAIKYTDTGQISVDLSRAGNAGDTLRLVVSDTGRGIAPADQTRVFAPFEQLETVSSKHTPGVGLGLALVKRMIEPLNGSVELSSQPGVGSRFTVTIPEVAVPS